MHDIIIDKSHFGVGLGAIHVVTMGASKCPNLETEEQTVAPGFEATQMTVKPQFTPINCGALACRIRGDFALIMAISEGLQRPTRKSSDPLHRAAESARPETLTILIATRLFGSSESC